ncbi:hypothetical protein [Roseibium sp.]|uniref:hypothetical protein n=1 Tax=Roseibium sp. TaxID=1936156 RepID=UPI003D1238D6
MKIDWTPPPPRDGLAGKWDVFVGPGATGEEEWVQIVFGGVLACICFGLFLAVVGKEATWVQIAAAGVLALDISGGVVTNAANSAKRWFHRAGVTTSGHLRFVAAHLLHLAVVAWLFSTVPLTYFGLTAAFLLASAVLVLALPLYLRRPSAFGLVAIGICLAGLPPFDIAGLQWFLPLLLLKLILGHALKEAPFRPEPAGDR